MLREVWALRAASAGKAYCDVFTFCAVGCFAVVPFTFLSTNYKPGGGALRSACNLRLRDSRQVDGRRLSTSQNGVG